MEGSRYHWNHLFSTESKNEGGQSSLSNLAFRTARMSWRAVAIDEINSILLIAGMRASSHLSSVRGLRLPECHGGQSLSLKSSLFYWMQEWGPAVILVLFRVLWLPGYHGRQSRSLKPPLFYWERKSDMRKSYSHRISNSIKVTAFTPSFFGVW